MREEVGATLTALIGALLVRLALTGAHRRYVKDAMGPWLLVAGIVLVVLGLFLLVRSLRRAPVPAGASRRHHDDAHTADHDHAHGGESVAWLLVVPVAVLLLVAPPALGSFAFGRSATVRVDTTSDRVFDPLDPGAAPVTMTLLEFDQRSLDGAGASFGEVPVEVTGFVARTDEGQGFVLARYQIACCAADAQAAVARVVGWTGPSPARDQWLQVIGTFEGGGIDQPILRASTVVPIPAPDDPYEG